MGMTEQKTLLLQQFEIANDIKKSPTERIIAWCEWGVMSRSTFDMASALHNIQDLIKAENQ